MKAFRAKHPDYYKNRYHGRHHWQQKYGLTPYQHEVMYLAQGGSCAICGEVPTKTLHVDHNHHTSRVRGLLCISCNYLVARLEHPLSEVGRAYLANYANQ